MDFVAAVIREQSGKFLIEELEIEEPRDDEVLVRIVGVCLEISEDLNFRVMEIVRAAGARFALPGKSIYMKSLIWA